MAVENSLISEHGDVTVAGPLPFPLSQPSATPAAVRGTAEGTGPARESDPLAAGVTPPEGATLASEGEPGGRKQTEPGGAVSVATGNSRTAENREATAPGHSRALTTQPSVTPATSRATASMSTGAVEGGRSTRGRRGRPRGSGRGTRATRTGATTNRGRIPRHGSGEVPSASAEGRVGGGEREGGEGGGPAPGSVTQLRTFIADDHSGTSCGGCRAAIARGHQVVGLPCGRQHAMHARCVVNAVRRGGAQTSLLCGARGCTVRHGRREAVEAAVQADPGLRVTAARPDDGVKERRNGLCYPWDQNTLGIAGPLDEQRFVTVVKVQPSQSTAHAKLITHVLGLLNHALGEHRQSTQPETPQSLLRSIKWWYILPALLCSQDGRMKRRERFASAERGDLTLLPP